LADLEDTSMQYILQTLLHINNPLLESWRLFSPLYIHFRSFLLVQRLDTLDQHETSSTRHGTRDC
jgi:hypothetical protein